MSPRSGRGSGAGSGGDSDADDPLLRPASDAGWDDAAPARPAAPRRPVEPKPTVAAPPLEPTPTVAAPPLEPKPTIAAPPLEPKAVSVEPKPASPAPKPASPASRPAPAREATAVPSVIVEPAPTAKLDAPTAKLDAPTAKLDAADPPLLPAKYDENDLRAAVGATPLAEATPASRKRRASLIDPEDDDEPRPPRNRKTLAILALGIAGGLGIIALVILGRLNSDRYLLACEPERAVPEQGRGFPPWGSHALDGDAWKPLKITPETRCQPHETDEPQTLARVYLAMILDQATALLSAREVTRVDDAEALLKQALLLTRPPEHESEALATERTEHHKEVERMLGDVTYWRASAKLRDASAALADAARQFEAAAAQHPRHVSDASAWATYTRKLAGDLTAGPGGAALSGSPGASAPASPAAAPTAAAPLTGEHPTIPAGIALPVEPARPTAAPVAPPPDAGVPTGGVLL